MNDHQPKTFMGIDLAATDADRTAVFVLARQIGKTEMQNDLLRGAIRDLGVSVEEAPEAPEPATDAPRTVTVESIEAKIAREDYFLGLNGSTLTICVLTMANGFDVTGESACVDPANFDEALGKKYARADAFKKIWPLEGYLLREQMMQAQDVTEPATDTGRAADEGWDGPAVRRNDYTRAQDAQDAPVTAHAAPGSDDFFDNQSCANALIGTQSASATFTDGAWMRQRAIELAQVDWVHSSTSDLIDRARQIEDYIAGKPEPEAVTEAAPPTDAQLIQRAKDVLVDAVTRGEAPACDQAGDAIQAMADWLNDVAVAD